MAVMAGALISYRWWTSGDQTMFSIKRNGASVEITEIPSSIPFSVFKNIADETGANECLVAYAKGKDGYEVVIRHDNVNMAAAAAWLASEVCKPVTGDADIFTIGKRIGVMRVKQHMSAQELEDAIGAPEGSVFRWETGKAEPSSSYINALAVALKCEPEWLLHGNSTNVIPKNELSKVAWLVTELEQEYEKAMKKAANIETCFSVCIRT
ncbi:helix-turn-helix domain-containing protein [Salmonella enterica]|nr:helix-turn-helix domain-containing protein [Salmonella enterica]